MGSLLADLRAAAAQTEHDAAVKKNDQTQAWNDAADKLKALAQNVIDGTSTAAEYKAATDDAKKTFPDKVGLISANLDSVLKAADTSRYNDYVSGGLSFQAWQDYAKDRKSDKAGAGALQLLTDRAQKNEDTVNYNKYIKGDSQYADWRKYVADRQNGKGGNLTDLQTLAAQAKHNEDRANDRRNQIAYNSGSMDPAKYQSYLKDRIASATSPDDLNALKAEQTSVVQNEFTKQVNEVIDGEQSGRLSTGDALMHLNSLKNSAPNAAAATAVLNRIAAYQKADAAKGGAGTTSLKAAQTEIDKMVNDAQSLFSKAVTNARTDAKDGGDPSSALRAITDAYHQMNFAYDQAAQHSTQPDAAAHYQNVLSFQQQAQSTDLRQAVSLAAGAARMSGASKGLAPTEASQRATDLLLQGSTHPGMTQADQLGLVSDARQLFSEVHSNIAGSTNSDNARSIVQNLADGLGSLMGPKGNQQGKDALASLQTLSGMGIQQDANGNTNLSAMIQAALLRDPGKVHDIAAAAGLDEFQGRDAAGYAGTYGNKSTFTKDWNSSSNELRGLDSFTTHFNSTVSSALSPWTKQLIINEAHQQNDAARNFDRSAYDAIPAATGPTKPVEPRDVAPADMQPQANPPAPTNGAKLPGDPWTVQQTPGEVAAAAKAAPSPQSPDARDRNALTQLTPTPELAFSKPLSAPISSLQDTQRDSAMIMPTFSPTQTPVTPTDVPPDTGGYLGDQTGISHGH